ncbi:hypothetical protein OX462_00265 [Janthinobacterium sp. SUN098]|uniref:hypothetical protein n=1 Tax=Janthinobacterium sp. SUN098 TaxID=3002437 RepID=UPI0038D38962
MGLFDFFRSPPSRDAFAQLVLRQIVQDGLASDSRYEREQFRIVSGSDDGHVFNLDNAYRDYCAAPRKQRAHVVQHYLSIYSAPGVPSSFADARASLMPVLRSRRQGDHLRLLAQTEPQRPAFATACQDFSEDAVVMLAYDTEANMATIGQATLAQWGVTFEQALAAAMDNLRDRTAHSFVALGNGLLLGDWNDAYDSSRLLLPDLLYRACEGGEPLVMVPTRGRFLLASSHHAAGQLAMVALADQLARDEGRQVSTALYGVRDGKIVACEPADAAVATALRRFQTIVRADLYNQQKEEWEQLNTSTGEDVFVASCLLIERQPGERVVSVSSWARDVHTLLPRTDVVALEVRDEHGERSGSKLLAWDEAQAIGGGLMEQIDCYPVRYRVRAFPDAQCVAAAPACEL